MIDTVSIGKIIKKLRVDKKMTQEELSEAVDISKNYLSKVERGLSRLNAETFLKMAEVLRFSLDDFGIKENYQYDPIKEKLVKLMLSSSQKEIKIYEKFINLINETNLV